MDKGIFLLIGGKLNFPHDQNSYIFLIVLGNTDVKSFSEIFAGTILLDADIFVLNI